MTQTITDSSARPFGRAFIFPGRDSCAHAHGSLSFTCAPVSCFFSPLSPQRVKARFWTKVQPRGGEGENRYRASLPRWEAAGRTAVPDEHRYRVLTGGTHNTLCDNTLESETYIYLFYFFFLAGTPAKNQEKNRAFVQQVFPRL